MNRCSQCTTALPFRQFLLPSLPSYSPSPQLLLLHQAFVLSLSKPSLLVTSCLAYHLVGPGSNSNLVKCASAVGFTNCFSNIPNNSAGWASPRPLINDGEITARLVLTGHPECCSQQAGSWRDGRPGRRTWRVTEMLVISVLGHISSFITLHCI